MENTSEQIAPPYRLPSYTKVCFALYRSCIGSRPLLFSRQFEFLFMDYVVMILMSNMQSLISF